jgi:predicted Fe-S protein YdhL (DUF1289 family)
MLWNPPKKPMLTPCVGICTLDRDGYCEGCWRTGRRDRSLGLVERRRAARIMRDVLPQREAQRA